MIKKVITVALLISSFGGFAQIGVGTKSPASSALLDLQSNGPIQRGLLVPRVELKDRFSSATFGDGIAANSLIVYNILESSELKIGFYYWDSNEWILFLTSNNIGEDPDDTVNISFTLDKGEGDVDSLVITDSADHIVSLPIADIAGNETFITSLVENKDFTLTLANNEDFVANLVTNEYFTTELANNNNFTTNLVENNQFTTDLSNNENFITNLTQNDTFVTEVKSWETITTMTAQQNAAGQNSGEYTYTNETPSDFTFNVVEDVYNNLKIISNEAGKDLVSKEGTIQITGDKALLAELDVDVKNFSIKPQKLNAQGFNEGDIATVQADGTVTYAPVDTALHGHTGSISTDGIIAVDPGHDRVLAPVNLSLNDTSVTESKLISKNKIVGTVATVVNNTTGAVDYQPLKGNMISDSGTLSTDEVIYASGITQGALLNNISLGINEFSIESYHLANHSVEPEKLDANLGANNRFAIANTKGDVNYTPLKSEMISDAGIISGDVIIRVNNNNQNTTLANVELSVNNKSIAANKLISTEKINGAVATSDKNGNVTYKKVSTEVLTDKGNITTDGIVSVSDEGKSKTLSDVTLGINDNTITADKLSSLGYNNGTVATAGKNGSVTYQLITPSSITDKAEIKASIENMIKVVGGQNAVLNPVTLSINERSITANKISSGDTTKQTEILTSNGTGGAAFVDAMDIGRAIAQADLKGVDNSLVVTGGEHVLLGQPRDSVTIRINDSGVLSKHIAPQSVIWNKLYGGKGPDNRFAISSSQGVVTYSVITPEVLNNTGSITTDNIIGFGKIGENQTNGNNKTLFDVNLKINDTSIDESKLTSQSTKGYVATVIDGGKVAYQGITSDMIVSHAPITTDDIILVDGDQEEIGAVLTAIKLSIKDHSIGNQQLKDYAVNTNNILSRAVTIDKLSSEGQPLEDQILVTDGEGGFRYGTLEDFTPDASDLTTDGIIGFGNDAQDNPTNGHGAVLNPLNLQINDYSIRNYKLSATNEKGDNIEDNKILVTDGMGHFEYTSIGAAVSGGEDLVLSNGMEFVKGNGALSLLSGAEIGIADNGVSNAKIAPLAVTTDKISSIENGTQVPVKSVLTSMGAGKTSYQTLQTLVLDEGKALASKQGSIDIISKENKSLLEDTTIDVAEGGIKNNHLEDLAVTSTKISSKQGGNNAGENTVLTADGKGNTSFEAGKSVTSKDVNETVDYKGSIEITDGTNAALNPMSLNVRENGILNRHIAALQITSDKISTDKPAGNVLVSLGGGRVEFADINNQINVPSFAPITNDAIHADFNSDNKSTLPLLAPLTLSLNDLGILNGKLANNEITSNKLSSWLFDSDNKSSDDSATKKSAEEYTVLTADGQGFVSYQFVEASSLQNKGTIAGNTDENIINVDNGTDAVLNSKGVTLSVNDQSITSIKLNSKVITKNPNGQITNTTNAKAKTVLTADGNGNVSFKPIEAVDYSLTAKETGEKWTDGSPVVRQVFDITIGANGANEITVPQAIPGLIIDARLINNSDNSVTRGIINKTTTKNSTKIKLGIPGFVTNYHVAGTYSLILEYVSPKS